MWLALQWVQANKCLFRTDVLIPGGKKTGQVIDRLEVFSLYFLQYNFCIQFLYWEFLFILNCLLKIFFTCEYQCCWHHLLRYLIPLHALCSFVENEQYTYLCLCLWTLNTISQIIFLSASTNLIALQCSSII